MDELGADREGSAFTYRAPADPTHGARTSVPQSPTAMNWPSTQSMSWSELSVAQSSRVHMVPLRLRRTIPFWPTATNSLPLNSTSSRGRLVPDGNGVHDTPSRLTRMV